MRGGRGTPSTLPQSYLDRFIFGSSLPITTTSRIRPLIENIHQNNTPPPKHITKNLQTILEKPIQFHSLLPIFTHTPPWLLIPPVIRFDLADLPKYTGHREYIQATNSILQEYPEHLQCFTDGSKIKNHSALAYSIGNDLSSLRLSNSASIYTAELSAIFMCLQEIAQRKTNTKYILVSDSLSSLQAITDPYSSHPLIQRILMLHHTIASNNISIIFLWSPGHIGLAKADIVDKAAKRATKLPKVNNSIRPPASDHKNELKKKYSSSGHEHGKIKQTINCSK